MNIKNKPRQRRGRLDKLFDAFMNNQDTLSASGGFWVKGGSIYHGVNARLGGNNIFLPILTREGNHFIATIKKGPDFPNNLGLLQRAAKVATGETCFFSRKGVVYFKSLLLDVPYDKPFKIPNRGEIK